MGKSRDLLGMEIPSVISKSELIKYCHPIKQALLIQEEQTDTRTTLWNQSEWKEEWKAPTGR